jgi:thiol-disulfide isomerase/thioredoxin
MNKKSIGIKIGLYILFSLLVWNAAGEDVLAADHPILYFFWGQGCPHCEKEKEFLTKLPQHYPELEMCWFETWKHPDVTKLADALRQAYQVAALESHDIPRKLDAHRFSLDEIMELKSNNRD